MQHPHFVLLYVSNPVRSAAFYADLLGKAAVEASPTFAMFVLDTGMVLGLWDQTQVQPAASHTGGGCELVFTQADAAAVRTVYTDWQARGLPIAQEPVAMDFGYTFTALDPDGHRLRVYSPSAA